MRLLEGVVRPYAWGSRTAIATIRGLPVPSAHPEAELWFGAHPAGQAECLDAAGRPDRNLLAEIEADPMAALGSPVIDEFGVRLPYLLKVLAAEEPLSLQAHPSAEQAAEGFARENAAGIRLDAPERNYRDPWHKPEVILAMTPFDALAGFRDPARTVDLLARLALAELDPYLGMIAGQPDHNGLRALFTTWITLPEAVLAVLVPAVIDAAVRVLSDGETEFEAELRTLLELGEAYPRDPGVLASLLLNRIHLEPGEALYLAAGNLHAYLRGTGIEVMANSDNVLRGGLTPKHIDVPELLRVLDFTPVSPDRLSPTVSVVGAERVYSTPAPEFRLSRVELDGTGLHAPSTISFDMPGPQILAVTSGRIDVRGGGQSLTAESGRAVWLADSDPDVVVASASSKAVFYRARVPLGDSVPDSR
ncbi:mannose-6-phosphate isomerase, class I [Gordonia sp. X0973]|uniref:mannose-6-phosphate isomerase, class I n=1 Tax=Gordonia sp. X0973 TaxID=2742602 RepID=UPI000F52C38A|nr:mannose-6-phosphate isomerase, class I [Gordonia sp. X0973]QKT07851.1 mannose-6-phosphate isomerase, class I [Gordonia sp. X0973]